jgi:hypothetical protein
VTPLVVAKDRKTEWEALGKMWGGGKATANVIEQKINTPNHDASGAPSNDMSALVLNGQPQYDDGDILEGYTHEDIEQACELLEKCLSPVKRAKDFGSWIDLGLCLFNICDEDTMMQKWAAFRQIIFIALILFIKT